MSTEVLSAIPDSAQRSTLGEVPHLASANWIKGARRLVQDDQVGPAEEGDAQLALPLLAARKVPDFSVHHRLHLQERRYFVDLFGESVFFETSEQPEDLQVLSDSEFVPQNRFLRAEANHRTFVFLQVLVEIAYQIVNPFLP
jgi:hypothetical protein